MKNKDIVLDIVVRIELFLNNKFYAKFTGQIIDYGYFIPKGLDTERLYPFHVFKLKVLEVEYCDKNYLNVEANKVIMIDDNFYYNLEIVKGVENQEQLVQDKEKKYRLIGDRCYHMRILLSKLINNF